MAERAGVPDAECGNDFAANGTKDSAECPNKKGALMRVGNNYTGARWAFSTRTRTTRRCVRCGMSLSRSEFIQPNGRICAVCRDGGFYCTECGALYSTPGEGFITCQQCGHLGLRGFQRRPRRVACEVEGCDFTGWDDGGVNNDLGRHLRMEHRDG